MREPAIAADWMDAVNFTFINQFIIHPGSGNSGRTIWIIRRKSFYM